MKIKLNTTMAGPEGVFFPDSVIDVNEKQAKLLIAGDYAEAIEPEEPKTTKRR